MNYFVITGDSKGLGRALKDELLTDDRNIVIGISRSLQPERRNYIHIQYDLSEMHGLEKCVNTIFKNVVNPGSFFLISNAGTIAPIGLIGQIKSSEVKTHLITNSITPVMLISDVIHVIKDWEIKRGVINISTGASKEAYVGWSCYCTSKAAMAMFMKCLRLECPEEMVVESYDPGVIDTQMQGTIRDQSAEHFPDVEKFRDFQSQGRLQKPSDAASKLIAKYFLSIL